MKCCRKPLNFQCVKFTPFNWNPTPVLIFFSTYGAPFRLFFSFYNYLFCWCMDALGYWFICTPLTIDPISIMDPVLKKPCGDNKTVSLIIYHSPNFISLQGFFKRMVQIQHDAKCHLQALKQKTGTKNVVGDVNLMFNKYSKHYDTIFPISFAVKFFIFIRKHNIVRTIFPSMSYNWKSTSALPKPQRSFI